MGDARVTRCTAALTTWTRPTPTVSNIAPWTAGATFSKNSRTDTRYVSFTIATCARPACGGGRVVNIRSAPAYASATSRLPSATVFSPCLTHLDFHHFVNVFIDPKLLIKLH